MARNMEQNEKIAELLIHAKRQLTETRHQYMCAAETEIDEPFKALWEAVKALHEAVTLLADIP